MKISKWHVFAIVGIVGIIVLMGFFLLDNSSQEQGKLRITYNPMPFNLPSMVERDQQFLSELGLDVQYNTFLAGHAMSEAMVAQELDVAVVMGGTSLITSVAGGRDIKIIAGYSQAPSGFALVGAVNGWTAEQLQGKRIAVPVGTEAHYLLGKILEEQGLTFADIEVVNMLIPDGIAALQSNQVDGTMAVEPMITRLVHNKQVAIIRDGTGLISGLTVSTVPIELEQALIDKFLIGQQKSLDFIENNFELALNVASEETGLPLALIKQIAPKYNFDMEISEDIKADLADTINFLFQQGIIRHKIDVEQLF